MFAVNIILEKRPTNKNRYIHVLIKFYTEQFQKVHKFKTNTNIEIRVYQGGKEFSTPFMQALELIHSTSAIKIVYITSSDVIRHANQHPRSKCIFF